jgi:chromosome segregation ATPase
VSVLVFALAFVARRSIDTAAKHAEQDGRAYADARADAERAMEETKRIAEAARAEADEQDSKIEENGRTIRTLQATIDVQSTSILRLQHAVSVCREAEAAVRRDLDQTRDQVRGLLAEMSELRRALVSGGSTA